MWLPRPSLPPSLSTKTSIEYPPVPINLLLVLSLALRAFSPGTPVFPSPQKPTLPNSNSTRNQVDEEPLGGCATSKSLLFIYLLPTPFICGLLAPPSLSAKTSIEYPPVPINCRQFLLTPNPFYMWPPRPSLPPLKITLSLACVAAYLALSRPEGLECLRPVVVSHVTRAFKILLRLYSEIQ